MSQGLALVAPFVSEHFSALHRLREFLSPPYDVLAEAERAALAQRGENVVHLILPQGDGNRYQRAARLLEHWRRTLVLTRENVPAVYVVQQDFSIPGRTTLTRTGLLGAVAAEPFGKGRVKPHEHTHAGPKQDRLALMRATQTMFESLLMMARDETGDLERALLTVTRAGAPWASADVKGEAVRVWQVVGDQAGMLAAAAGESLYLADGHHRYETAVAYRTEQVRAARTLALVVSVQDPGLVVLPTHRILRGEPPSPQVVQQLERLGRVEEASGGPEESLARVRLLGGGCVMVLPGERLLVVTRRDAATDGPLARFHPAVRALDVTWADAYAVELLNPGGGSVAYSSSIGEVISAVRSGAAGAGVLLNPPAVADVLDVADAGGFMPQKSTYFMPKVPSGLVMLPYQEGD
ncbi:MAG TPA: DUF1015 domain-containing protein [Gemmatimonadales bacterium]|nr:DUF1015 domain-containing protein [Gemmatimonadales bacterium]